MTRGTVSKENNTKLRLLSESTRMDSDTRVHENEQFLYLRIVSEESDTISTKHKRNRKRGWNKIFKKRKRMQEWKQCWSRIRRWINHNNVLNIYRKQLKLGEKPLVCMLRCVNFLKWLNGENILKTWRKCSNCTRIWKPIWLTTNGNQSQIMAWKGYCVSASQDQLEKR